MGLQPVYKSKNKNLQKYCELIEEIVSLSTCTVD